MRIISTAILACALALAFVSCGPKPKPSAKAEKPHFEITRVSIDERMVVVSFPVLLASTAAWKDSSYQLYAAYYTLVTSPDTTWVLMDGNDYRVETNSRFFPRIYGYVRLPEKGDWFLIRVWVKMVSGRKLFVWPGDLYAGDNKSKKPGYEFVINVKTGEKHPVPKRE